MVGFGIGVADCLVFDCGDLLLWLFGVCFGFISLLVGGLFVGLSYGVGFCVWLVGGLRPPLSFVGVVLR